MAWLVLFRINSLIQKKQKTRAKAEYGGLRNAEEAYMYLSLRSKEVKQDIYVLMGAEGQ